jgi:hypothetical protein
MEQITFTKLKKDINGNSRFVCHWTCFNANTYTEALNKAHTIGGKKYHNKTYGGGIVFQEYESRLPLLSNLIQSI